MIGPRADRRTDRIAMIALLAVVGVVAYFVLQTPILVGQLEDDGVYLATAHSLANGDGYRHPQLPGRPWQTKYPVGYPAILALLWRCEPALSENMRPVQLANVAFLAIAALASYAALRRAWKTPPLVAVAGISLALLSPATVALAELAMSESLYTALCALALWLAACLADSRVAALAGPPAAAAPIERKSIGSHPIIGGLVLGAISVAAYLTRSTGVALLLAVFISLVPRMRVRQLFAVALVAFSGAASWQWWRTTARVANAAIPASAALRYDLDYSYWLPHDFSQLIWIVINNICEGAFGFFHCLFYTAGSWAAAAIDAGGVPLAMLCGAVVIPSLLALIGLLVTWRREQPVIHAFVILSGILILCWPFTPKRFLLPLLPYLCTALLIGVGAVLRTARRLFADANSKPRNTLEQWAAAGVALFLAIPAWSMNTRLLSARGVINANEQRGRLLTFIRENTPADACIAGAQGSTLHLLTGRQFVPIQSAPGAWAYSADRRPLAFGWRIAPGAERLAADTILKELVDYYTIAGVNYMLLNAKDDVEGGAYRRFLALNSDQFAMSAATPEFRLYYFVPSRPPPRAP